MSAAHPWLGETPWPTAQIERSELTIRIEHLLATQWMGVLCTLGKNGPIGSPVEYYAEGMRIYILPQPNSPKMNAMKKDPRLCFAIHAENSGWASVKGAQIFGNAKFIEPGTPEHEHGMNIYRWQSSSIQLDRPIDEAPQVPLLVIDPERVVYTEHWLRKDGFGPRQIWHSDPEKAGSSRKYGH